MLPLPIGADYAAIVGAQEVAAGMVTLQAVCVRSVVVRRHCQQADRSG